MDNPKKNGDYLVIYEARATKSKIGFNYYSKSVRIMSFVDNEWHTPKNIDPEIEKHIHKRIIAWQEIPSFSLEDDREIFEQTQKRLNKFKASLDSAKERRLLYDFIRYLSLEENKNISITEYIDLLKQRYQHTNMKG